MARDLGFCVQVVERFCHFSRRRIDLFGCLDLILVKEGVGIIGVQACADSSHAARVAKVKAEPRMVEWLAAGGRVEVWSWGLRGARGKRKVWTVRREEIKAEDIATRAGGEGGGDEH